MNRFISLFLFTISFFVSHSQQKWKNYTASDFINCFAFDKDTVWIGSDGGVAKYLTDGTRLAFYTKADGLASDYISAIAIDSIHNKWFTTGYNNYGPVGNGVSKFDGTNWTTYSPYNSGLGDSAFTSVLIDKSGRKWFTDLYGEFYQFNDTIWVKYSSSDSALIHGFCPILDSYRNSWYCSGNQLTEFNGVSLINYPFPIMMNHIGHIKGCLIDKHNNLWVYGESTAPGTEGGLFKFDGTNWSNYTGTVNSTYYTMAIDSNDNLWLDDYKCIYKFGPDGISRLCNAISDSFDMPVTVLTTDNKNNLWVGATSNQKDGYPFPLQNVWKFNGTNWLYISPYNSPLSANSITSIVTDKHNNVWVSPLNGTTYRINNNTWQANTCLGSGNMVIDDWGNIWNADGGLSKFDGTNCSSYSDLITIGGTVDVAVDHKGIAWYSGFFGGIGRFDGTNWTHEWQNQYPLSEYTTQLIAIDKKNNLWLSLSDFGVAKFDGSQFTIYTPANSGLPDSELTSIVIDMTGNPWIGTYWGGVAKFDGTNWTTYNTANSGLPGNYITAMTIDKNNNLWVGSTPVYGNNCSGLSKFDGSNWVTYNTNNSNLSDNCIGAISVDKLGNVWVGTDNEGISELLSTDTSFNVGLQFDGNICSNSTVILNPTINFGSPPYNYSWKAIGDTITCNNCLHPNTTITQTSTFIVHVMDNNNKIVSDTLVIQPCLATGITQIDEKNAVMSIYPNPFNSNITVILQKDDLKKVIYTIFNVLGQPLYLKEANIQIAGNSATQLNLNNLPDGFYFIEAIADGQRIVKQIVKQ